MVNTGSVFVVSCRDVHERGAPGTSDSPNETVKGDGIAAFIVVIMWNIGCVVESSLPSDRSGERMTDGMLSVGAGPLIVSDMEARTTAAVGAINTKLREETSVNSVTSG